jgi:hypothetical protein
MDLCIDAYYKGLESYGRTINHSMKKDNLKMFIKYGNCEQHPKGCDDLSVPVADIDLTQNIPFYPLACLYAKTDIAEGSELFWNYCSGASAAEKKAMLSHSPWMDS